MKDKFDDEYMLNGFVKFYRDLHPNYEFRVKDVDIDLRSI